MAIRSKKVLKALAEKALANDNKKKTPSEYNKDGSPKNWPKVLKRVPVNRNVRVKHSRCSRTRTRSSGSSTS